MLEDSGRFLGRMKMEGALPCPHGKWQRPSGEAGRAKVLRDVNRPFGIVAVQPFHRLSDRSVQRASLARHQVAEDRFANQGMPKRQPVAILEYEILLDRRSGALQQWRLRSHEHLENVVVGASPD